MNRKQLILITLITILSLYSCKKELTDLGSDLIPAGQKLEFAVDTLNSIQLSTISNPFVSMETYINNDSKTSTMLIGSYNDSEFGNITSDFISEIYPAYLVADTFKNITAIDSVVLTLTNTNLKKLKYQTYIGDTNLVMNFNFGYLSNILKPNVQYTADEYNSLKGDFIQASSFRMKDTLNIKMDNAFGEKLVGYTDKNYTVFEDVDKYRNYIKGLYIEAEKLSNKGCIGKYSMPYCKVSVYCKEGAKISSKIFFLSSPRNKNIIHRDYSTTAFADHIDKEDVNGDFAYTSSLRGPVIKFSKDSLLSWKERILKNTTPNGSSTNLNIAINKVEILIPVPTKDISNIQDSLRGLSPILYSVKQDTLYNYITRATYDSVKKIYVFDITSFIHNYVREKNVPENLIISTDFLDSNRSESLFELKKSMVYNNTNDIKPMILISYTKL